MGYLKNPPTDGGHLLIDRAARLGAEKRLHFATRTLSGAMICLATFSLLADLFILEASINKLPQVRHSPTRFDGVERVGFGTGLTLGTYLWGDEPGFLYASIGLVLGFPLSYFSPHGIADLLPGAH